MSLREIQKIVDKWINQFEEGYWPPLSMFASVVEEVGELGREINNLEGYKKKLVGETTNISLELADIIFSIICIANYYKIDLEKAFLETMKKYTGRDFNRWTLKKK
jgi:NTP pyrophosphatase (non-canonical NTP hydrolase)